MVKMIILVIIQSREVGNLSPKVPVGLLLCCMLLVLLSSRPQGQVGEYADAMAGESPSAKHCLPSSTE
ncbi:MAG: hypothetical protein LBG58_01725 [Planctomycetaceae bacterium]|jgi:hypothetical protein|nr:hypothetical protein [Planctomycetaceae bacterium]